MVTNSLRERQKRTENGENDESGEYLSIIN
jgi:hypothetical protein